MTRTASTIAKPWVQVWWLWIYTNLGGAILWLLFISVALLTDSTNPQDGLAQLAVYSAAYLTSAVILVAAGLLPAVVALGTPARRFGGVVVLMSVLFGCVALGFWGWLHLSWPATAVILRYSFPHWLAAVGATSFVYRHELFAKPTAPVSGLRHSS